MNCSTIDPKTSINQLARLPAFAFIVLAGLALLPAPNAFGVTPAPDGGYSGANTAEGTNALFQLSSGINNTAIGDYALRENQTGSLNTAIGAGALRVNVVSYNTATGWTALNKNETGTNNTATGAAALGFNVAGNNNTASTSTDNTVTYDVTAPASTITFPVNSNTYNAAGWLCRCLRLADKDARLVDAERKKLARNYAEQALALLRQAVAGGYKDVARMKQDPDLEPLRAREEFRKLLVDLERKPNE